MTFLKRKGADKVRYTQWKSKGGRYHGTIETTEDERTLLLILMLMAQENIKRLRVS